MTREEAIQRIEINREALKNINFDGYAGDIKALDMAIEALSVVRCKDCKHYVSDWNTDGYVCRHPKLEVDIECSDHWVATKETDHCSYGERRENE